MKFLPLVWSGIWRKPGRTILIFFQVSVAFALFGVLQGMKTGVEQVISETRADLLLVHGSLSMMDPLPLGLLEQIKSVPGVRVVVPVELLWGHLSKAQPEGGRGRDPPRRGLAFGVHLHDCARIRRGFPAETTGSTHQRCAGEKVRLEGR